MTDLKIGQTVYAVKAKDDGTEATDHRCGYNKQMDEFAKGNVKGKITDRIGDIFIVETPTGGWSYDASELRLTPRRAKAKVSKAAIRTKKVLAKAPKKVYAVVKGNSTYTALTRDGARELKSILGGKAEGAVIVAYTLLEEIR